MVRICPDSGVIPSMLGLYLKSVHYQQFLRHTFGYGNSSAHGQTLCVLRSIDHSLPPARLFTPMHVNIPYIIKVLSPTDAQDNCFKRSHKIYIKTVPTCFGVITIIRKRNI